MRLTNGGFTGLAPGLTVGVALVMALSVVVSAQRGAGRGRQQTPSPRPVFRAAANYVSLDVVVTDKDDRPVTDLRQDEFTIVENRVPQVIADFTFVSIPSSYRPLDLTAARPPAVDVVSNTLSPNASRALAIVVDDTHLPPQEVVRITRALQGVLEGLAPDDQVAFTYVRRSDLGHDFTNDRERLAESVNRLRDAVGLRSMGRFPIRDLFIVLENAIDTLKVARQSRKAIIMVNTRGCDPSNRDTGSMCRGVIDRALEAGVPIYGLNPLGLTDAMSTAGAGAYESAEGRAGLEAEIANENNSLKILARETGGRAFVQSNLQAAVQAVMSDNGNFYLLGYYPNPGQTDGKFHKVDVAVTRPGLRVRSREGYLASGGRVERTTDVREMTRILGEGLPDPGLSVRGFVAPMIAGRKGTTSIVTVELAYPVPAGGFGGDFKDQWRLGILALDSEGKIRASFQRPLTFTGRWKATARGTFILDEVIDLPHNTASVRVGVTSQLLDKTGSVHLPLTVPDFGKKELQLSSLVVGVAGEWANVVDAVIGLDRIRGLVPFQPAPQRVFSASQSLRVYSKAWWKSDESSLTGDVRIIGTSSSVAPVTVQTTGSKQVSGSRRAEIDKTIALAGLAPGAYILQVTVHVDGKEPAVREIPFEIR